MKVALLVDNGGIIEKQQAINPVRDAITGFVETLPPEHAVSLVTIGGHIGWRVDFTTDRGQLLESAREMHTDSAAIGLSTAYERRGTGGSRATRHGRCSSPS